MLYNIFFLFCLLLPFQFALNPAEGIDLAIVRVIIPFIFLLWMFFDAKKDSWLFKKNKIGYLLITFILLAIFSLSFSHNIYWSLRKLLFLLSLAPVYFVAVSVFSKKSQQRKTIIALVLGTAVIAFFGIIQFFSQFVFGIDTIYSFLAKHIMPFFLGYSFSEEVLKYPSWLVNSGGITYMRAFANFPDPHMFSYYMEMLLPFSLALWATTTSHKKLFLLSSFFIILADILTFTRGSYIALISGALIILPIVSKNTAKKLLLGVILFACLIIAVPNNPVGERFVSSFDTQEGSNQARISNWQQALSVIVNHPSGVGIGMYPLEIKPNADYREPIYAHNLYMDIASELGIISAIVFIAILFYVLIIFWKKAREDNFFMAGVSCITIFAVHSLVENPLYSVHILVLLLIIIALGSVIKQYEKNNFS